jgi:hypothetical protein
MVCAVDEEGGGGQSWGKIINIRMAVEHEMTRR